MARNLPNGVRVPQATDPISASGVDEMVTLGTTADAAIGGLVVTAEDLDDRLSVVESQVDAIKLSNSSMGEGAPTGAAPVGWWYTDIVTGDVYKMEA